MSHSSPARIRASSRLRKIYMSRAVTSILAALLALCVGASLLRFDLSNLVVQPVYANSREDRVIGHLTLSAPMLQVCSPCMSA